MICKHLGFVESLTLHFCYSRKCNHMVDCILMQAVNAVQ